MHAPAAATPGATGGCRITNTTGERRAAKGPPAEGLGNIATRFADEATGLSRQASTALMLCLRGRDTPGGPKARPVECYSLDADFRVIGLERSDLGTAVSR
jgi:hypothetical protein